MARGFRIASAYVEVSARTDKAQMRRSAERVGRQGGGAYSSGFGAAAGAGMRRNADRAHQPMDNATGKFSNAGRQGGSAFAGGFGATAAAGMGSATRKAEEPLRGSESRFSKEGQAGGRGFKTGVSAGLGGFAGAFTPVTAAVGLVTGVLGGAVLGASKDFQAGMNGVRAITGATGKDFKELEGLAKEMGSTTQFSAGEAASAMEFLGMAGWDTKEIMDGLPDVLNLAASSGLDLADAADVASNIMSGFGIEATEAGRVADVLAAAASSANVDVGMLGESMKYAAPIASAAGWSLEETAAAVGLLGDAGMQGSMAGTGLNSILGTLADTSSAGGKKLKEFGVSALDSAGEVRPLTEILADLSDEGAGVADVLSIFGLEAGPKMQALLGRGSEGLQQLITDLENSEGAAQEMADIRMEGLEGSLKGAGSALEGMMLAIGDMGILDGATQAVSLFSDAVRGLTGFLTEHGDSLKPVITAIGIFAGAVAGIIAVALGVKLAIAGVAAAFAILASPVALVVAGIAALVAGLVYAWKNSETFRDIVTGALDRIKQGWNALWEGALKPGLGALMDLWREHWPTIRATAEDVFDRITEAWSRLWNGALKPGLEAVVGFVRDQWPAIKQTALDVFGTIQDKIDEIRPHVEKVFGQISEIVSGVLKDLQKFWDQHGGWIMGTVRFLMSTVGGIFKGAFQAIGGVISGAWKLISTIFQSAFQTIGGILDIFIGLFTGDWARMWDGVKGIVQGLVTAVVGIFQGLVTILGGIIKGLITVITTPFMWLYNWLVGNSLVPDMVNAVAEWFGKMRDWVRDRVRALVDRVVAFFTNLRNRASALVATLRDWVVARIATMRDNFLRNVTGLRDRALSLFTGLRDRVRGIADNIRDWITTRITTLRDRVVNRFENLRDKAISAFTKAKDGIKSVWDKLKAATKAPVNFVIETVYTGGIKKFWDSIASKINMPKLPPIAKLASGGRPDGRTHGGTPGVDSIPALLMADEYVLKRDSARKIGFGNLEYMNRTGQMPSMPVQKFSRGGIVGEAVGNFLSKGKDFFKDGFMKAVKAVTGPIKNTMRDMFGSSGFKGLPTKIVDFIIGKLHTFLSPFEETLSGGDGSKVVEVARKEVGVSGRPNKYTRAPGMWTDEWCGMFVDWVFKKANAFDALKGVNGTPAVRNFTSLPKVSRANARPGDLPLYRGDTGHINILTDPKTGETVGGNESNSVRKQFGYVNSASSIRRPRFASGGLVDAAAVQRAGSLEELRAISWQDSEETPDRWLTSTDRRRRDLFAPPEDVPATHDSGGVVLDKHAAVNRRGEAELVVLREEMRAWASAAKGGGDIHMHFAEGAISISAKDIAEMRGVHDFFNRVQHEARRHGARMRTGAPR